MNFKISVTGEKSAATAAILADNSVPEKWRAAITDTVANLPDANGATITAFSQVHRGIINLHLTIAPLTLAR